MTEMPESILSKDTRLMPALKCFAFYLSEKSSYTTITLPAIIMIAWIFA